MNRVLISISILLLAAAAFAGEGTVYGAGVTLEQPVSIAELAASPQGFVGQKVRVDGVISAVCEHRGCWIQVNDADSGAGIRVKVEDGVIVFPMTAMGHRASAEGVLEAVPVAPKAEAEKHAAEGHTCTGHAEAGQEVVYLIRGTGAVIY